MDRTKNVAQYMGDIIDTRLDRLDAGLALSEGLRGTVVVDIRLTRAVHAMIQTWDAGPRGVAEAESRVDRLRVLCIAAGEWNDTGYTIEDAIADASAALD